MTPVERRIHFQGGAQGQYQRKPRAKLDEALRIAMEQEALLVRIVEADPASRASLIEEARKLVCPPKPVERKPDFELVRGADGKYSLVPTAA